MNKKNTFPILRISLIILSGFFLGSIGVPKDLSAAMSAQQIMEKNENNRRMNDIKAQAIIVTGTEGKPQKVKQFSWWRKLASDGTHFDTLTRFLSPAEIRGEGILFLEHPGSENEVLMYLPNFKKIRRVEPQQQSGSFMGSELSYSDISTPHVSDYNHRLIGQQPCLGVGSKEMQCFVVETTPKNEAVRNSTGYSKTVHWVRMNSFMDSQTEFYDLQGVLFKRFVATEITKVDIEKDKWMALKVQVSQIKTGRFTTLEFSKVQVNQGLAASLFTQQNLSKNGF
jgi:outer membrane lipoprotein-sorting protein